MSRLPEIINFDGISKLEELVQLDSYSHIFILCDENTARDCLPVFIKNVSLSDFHLISIKSGEEHKTLETCQLVWHELLTNKADRKSVLINLGGGVIGDLGGFCAATYMRGMPFVQVPTTLLAQVDASVGGKTGVDFHHFKNIIGVFGRPELTTIDPVFLKTLPRREFDSGFVEILKHALIADAPIWSQLSNEFRTLELTEVIKESVAIKQNIVKIDPFESGLRKALNFGHTVGHALENLALSQYQDIRHGEAVAFGIVVASHLSTEHVGLTGEAMEDIVRVLSPYCKHLPLHSESDTLIELLKSDKKNVGNELRFTLLPEIGNVLVDQVVGEASIKNSILHCIEIIKKQKALT